MPRRAAPSAGSPKTSEPESPPEAAESLPPPGEADAICDAGWKDELNLAEFPITALTDRIPDGQTTLVFEDRLEPRDGPPIIRRLTIMGTAKHGLPTSLDDEVLVGLIQLTKRRSNFTNARVSFSRYELIELLGWPQSGQSYRRIEEALHRWVGVVLMYENAWWDNAAKSWVDEQFHVLDNVTLYDRERWRRASTRSGKGGRAGADKPPPPLSSFRWNEVIFQSFQSGNLKQLDLELYLKLRLPTTKRMYRFLDKRFYRRTRLDFDLRTLACEHIGLSRSYAPSALKRRLKPALEELERLGFLEALDPDERYTHVKRGVWRIILIRGRRGPMEPDVEPVGEPESLVRSLQERGVSAKIARELVDAHPAHRVQAKVEVFDWLIRNEDKRVAKNPAGYLVASIRADYQAPEDYQPPAESKAKPKTRAKAAKPKAKAAKAKTTTAPRSSRSKRAAAEAVPVPCPHENEAKLRAIWEKLPEADRDAILASVKAEHPGLSRWRNMLEPLCLAVLETRLRDQGAETAKAVELPLFPDDSA